MSDHHDEQSVISRRYGSIAAALVFAALASCDGNGGRNPVAPPGTVPTPVVPAPAPLLFLQAVTDTVTFATTGSDVHPVPAVRVVDLSGKPVPGVVVTFSTRAGGGSVRNATATADTGGVATCSGWTLGPSVDWNGLVASIPGGSNVISFRAWGRLPDPPGETYELRTRGGMPLASTDAGYLVLANDGSFRLAYFYGLGTGAVYVADNTGTVRRSGPALSLLGDGWDAAGELQGDVLTLTYDDILDLGFHSIVVDVYARKQ